MKKITGIICMLLIWQSALSQNKIINWQYWFDSDYSTLTTEPMASAGNMVIDREISVAGLEEGLHVVHFRFEDENKKWSPALSRFFSYYLNSGIPEIRQVTQFQYWIDENFGEASTIELSKSTNLNIDELVEVSALTQGLHVLHYRFKDETGGWSPALSRFFSYYLNSGIPEIRQVTQFQYWIDENFESVTTVDFPSAKAFSFEEMVDVSFLREGLHILNYRFKDAGGGWSPVLSKFFSKRKSGANPAIQEITKIEYWFNQDNSTSAITDISGLEKFELNEFVDVSGLGNGLHVINYRFMDAGNSWSPAVSRFFSKYDLPKVAPDNQIVGYRYWVDRDTSTMTNVNIQSPLKSYILDELIDVYDYPSGLHYLNIQFKDKTGKWNSAITDTVILELNPSAVLSASTIKLCVNGEISFFADTVDITNIEWNFGDGKTSNLVNPFHVYETAGKFKVSATVSHVESDRIKTVFLADSVSVYPVYNDTINMEVCSADLPYRFGTANLSETGMYTGVFQSVNGCDSSVTVNLIVNESYAINKNLTICETDLPYSFGSQSLTVSGIYTEVFNLATGCDSMVTLNFKIKDCTVVCNNLRFAKGWNIFSVNSQPGSANVQTVFQPFITNNSLIKIQDEQGNSLENWGVFGGWTNNIGNLDPAEGYKIKISGKDSIEICGVPVTYPFAIPLKNGWNIMGYPQTKAFDGMDNIVNQLISKGKLLKVQDEGGNSIEDWGIFGGWTNNIGNFLPGEGYKIKVSGADTLWILEGYPKSSVIPVERRATTHYHPVYTGNGVDHMNINLVRLPLNVLKTGDELAVYDGENCVGAVTVLPRHLRSRSVSIIASAGDYNGMQGFLEGNPFTLKLWSHVNNQEYILEPEIVKGTYVFTKHETSVARLEKYATTGLNGNTGMVLTEIRCYPNPFSDEIKIELNAFNESRLQVDVYDYLGRKIKELYKGNHNGKIILTWDGTGENGRKAAEGIYFVKINELWLKLVKNKLK